jgi:hypothetical protein
MSKNCEKNRKWLNENWGYLVALVVVLIFSFCVIASIFIICEQTGIPIRKPKSTAWQQETLNGRK